MYIFSLVFMFCAASITLFGMEGTDTTHYVIVPEESSIGTTSDLLYEDFIAHFPHPEYNVTVQPNGTFRFHLGPDTLSIVRIPDSTSSDTSAPDENEQTERKSIILYLSYTGNAGCIS
jgi:hypothetical protein